jgi:hypothetical protein
MLVGVATLLVRVAGLLVSVVAMLCGFLRIGVGWGKGGGWLRRAFVGRGLDTLRIIRIFSGSFFYCHAPKIIFNTKM